MPDLLFVLRKWWKTILGLVVAAMGVTALILWVQPKLYLSVVTALPASSLATDKAKIFNAGIQELYSTFGDPDDVDRLLGTADLDTLYIAAVQAIHLTEHYHSGTGRLGLYKAVWQLKKNTRIVKSEYNILKVKVWDTDPQTAADGANILAKELGALHQYLQKESNEAVLKRLKDSYAALLQSYSREDDALKNFKNGIKEDSGTITGMGTREAIRLQRAGQERQLQQYQQLIGEYTLVAGSNPPALLIAEGAQPAVKWDKPRVTETLAFVLFASLFFGVLLAVFLESRK